MCRLRVNAVFLSIRARVAGNEVIVEDANANIPVKDTGMFAFRFLTITSFPATHDLRGLGVGGIAPLC